MRHPVLVPWHRGTLVNAARNAFELDRSQFAIGFALRCTVGVAISLVGALAAGSPGFGVAGAIGALSAGFASLQGYYRTRAAAMLWTAFGMALSTFVGGLAGHSVPALIGLMALWGYGYGILAALGPAATVVGLNSCVAFIIFSDQPLSVGGAGVQALLVLAGGLLQTILLVVVWPLSGYSLERRALAGAYRILAEYAHSVASDDQLLVPGTQELTRVRDTLSDPQPFARRGDIAVFQALLDEAERIRASLGALATVRYLWHRQAESNVARALDDFWIACGELLTAVAAALRDGRPPEDRTDAWPRVESVAVSLEHSAVGAHALSDVRALLGQLRSVWYLARVPSGESPKALAKGGTHAGGPTFPKLEDVLATLRASLSLSSPYARHGIRLAATLGVAMLLYRALHIDHGYWMAMTAVLVLKPDFTTTLTLTFARIGGTVLGALLAAGLALAVPSGPRADVALALVFATLVFALQRVNYGLFAIALTAYIVFLLALLGQHAQTSIVERVLATLGGGLLAEAATFVWPTWEARRASDQLAELLGAQRRYADTVFRAYLDPAQRDFKAIRDAQTAAWAARAQAEASVDRMLTEPPQTHALAADTALGVLAASRRFGVGVLTLNAHTARAARVARPALRPLVDALEKALRSTAAALRTRSAPRPYPPLRDAFEAAKRAHAAVDDPDAAEIFSEVDLLVDSANTMNALVAADVSAHA